jgi:hypothetical protein
MRAIEKSVNLQFLIGPETGREFEMAKKENIPDDTYARESFTFRRMTKGQLWSITLAVVVLVVIAIAYSVA